MIRLLFGENSYAREAKLAELIGDAEPERVDGATLELRDLPSLLTGQTLFSDARTIVIRHLSENTAVWTELEVYLERIPPETNLFIIDAKPDKRTRTYKALQKLGEVHEFLLPKNAAAALTFALNEAKARGLTIERSAARQIVERVGINPWNIVHALEKLTALGVADQATIERVIEASPSERVFGLFEASLRGQTERVRAMCQTLALSEDPYRVMGLLATQATQLAAVAIAGSGATVARDLGLKNDYGLTQLRPFANGMSRRRLQQIVTALAEADGQMKSSGEDPWALIEQALQKIAVEK